VRVLVTGASGFLGGHIVDQCLDQGDQVRALVRKNSDLTYLNTLKDVEKVGGDLCDPSALHAALKGIDVVYHSAARVVDFGSREQFYTANVLGTQHLLNAAKKNGVSRFIFISSPSVLMDMKDQIDVNETLPSRSKYSEFYDLRSPSSRNMGTSRSKRISPSHFGKNSVGAVSRSIGWKKSFRLALLL
jgi:nucleoside-diphosphate-sugar epimerase